MSLTDYFLDQTTDKGTWHSYIELYYNGLFKDPNAELKILEIGISRGASLRLWNNYFYRAEIWGVDNNKEYVDKFAFANVLGSLYPRIKTIHGDAFTNDIRSKFPDDHFNVIIEDGPHTIETQIWAAKHWSSALKVGGKLVIEDVQDSFNDYNRILKELPSNCTAYYFDFRHCKNRYDDFIVEITRNS